MWLCTTCRASVRCLPLVPELDILKCLPPPPPHRPPCPSTTLVQAPLPSQTRRFWNRQIDGFKTAFVCLFRAVPCKVYCQNVYFLLKNHSPCMSRTDPWLEACAQTRVKHAQACAVLDGNCA